MTSQAGKTHSIDLTPFLGDGQSRYSLDKTKVIGGWECATNGWIMVCVPTDRPDTLENGMPYGHFMEGIVKETDPKACVIPWPADGFVEGEIDCPLCKGGIVGGSLCTECDGAGQVTCSKCQEESDCKICCGRGILGGRSCACRGQKVVGEKFQRLQDNNLNARIARQILALPGEKKYAPVDKGMTRFIFEGGMGAVMGMSV